MSRIIRLHDIEVKALSHPHSDLPSDMQIFGQLIVDKHIILQTVPLNTVPSQNIWKLEPQCAIPHKAETFILAIMRHSKTQGTRLLGFIEIGSGQALTCGENQNSLCVNLMRVNIDGPMLRMTANFSVSRSANTGLQDVKLYIGDQITSVESSLGTVATHLQQMNSSGKKIQSGTLLLWIMHERILLLPSNDQRSRLLSQLGDTCLKWWRTSHRVDDLNQAVQAYSDAVRDHSENITYLEDFGDSLFLRFRELGHVNDINRSVLIYTDAVHLTPDGHHKRASRLNNLGSYLGTRFQTLGNLEDLTESISKLEDAIHLTPDGHPDKPGYQNNLASSLLARFQQLGDLGDLHNSISNQKHAVQLTPDSHIEARGLSRLGISLLTRFERLGDVDDLNEGISKQRDAIHLTPDGHPDKPGYLNTLGSSLRTRFEQFGDLLDLHNYVSKQERAVQLTPDHHPDKPGYLNKLGYSLRTRFKQLGDLIDLHNYISNQKHAVQLTPGGHPDKPGYLNNLGIALQTRFEQLGDIDDLNESISKQREADNLALDGHPEKLGYLKNLGNSLQTRFKQLGDIVDLNESISKHRDAIHLTPDGHLEARWLSNFGTALLTRFEQLDDVDDLNEGISKQRDAVDLDPDGHPDKRDHLTNLGISLQIRFKRLGNLNDLNEAIAKLRNAIHLTPNGHPDMPNELTSLAVSLWARFQRVGDLSDLNECISKGEEAVHLTPDSRPDKPSRLNNLAHSLQCRFERLGKVDDLSKAISKQRDALDLIGDDHPLKAGCLSNLGISLLFRFERFDSLDDLHECISKQELAVHLTPDSHQSKSAYLSNLGDSLMSRFKRLGDIGDLNEGISKLENALGLTQADHQDRPSILQTLGNALFHRLQQSHNPKDGLDMIQQYSSAACSSTGPAHMRFHAACMWGLTANLMQHPSLMNAYQVALDLLPEVAWLGLSLSDRHHQVIRAGLMVRYSATVAISFDQPEKAVEWLEQGRSVIWGQLLHLRSPVDDLKEEHPKLADELIFLSTQLEKATTRTQVVGFAIEPTEPTEPTEQTEESIKQQSHENALKRASVLKEIREIAGFQRFLLPRTISELSAASQKGPVVFLNASGTSCDALALLPGLTNDVMHIPLPEFTPEHVKTLTKSLNYLLPYMGRGDVERLQVKREGASGNPEDDFAHILSELWTRVVKPVLDALAITTPMKDNLPRLWWCPTGSLTSLPIHAAGLYGKEDFFGSKLSDFVISSFTPSLAALIQGFRPNSGSPQDIQLLAVAQPSAVGQSRLPGTREEIDRIQQCAKDKLPVVTLVEHEATVARVEDGIMKSSWVHFACHGVQDRSTPTQSALLLDGSSRLTLERIIQLNLPRAEFAFLSACQTATGDKKLQEESVHLAAGMLLAGYRGVIATMWSIMDNDAPQVAADVYDHLFKTSPPDSTRAAEALHVAVRNLREGSGGKKSFFHWVPFIHVGV